MGQCSGAEVRGICTEAGTSLKTLRDPHLTDCSTDRHVRSSGTAAACHAGGFRVCGGEGAEEEPGGKYVCEQVVLVVDGNDYGYPCSSTTVGCADLRMCMNPYDPIYMHTDINTQVGR